MLGALGTLYLMFAVIETGGTFAARNIAVVLLSRPPMDVFEMVASSGALRRWVGDLGETAPARDRPLRTGARAFQTIEVGGRREAVEVVVTDVEPGRLVAVHLFNDALDGRAQVFFEPADSGTRLTVVADTEFHRLTYRALSPVIQMVIGGKLARDLDRLKLLAEARHPVP
jgi:uncharacterized protein YndB with AHSA1/START domain